MSLLRNIFGRGKKHAQKAIELAPTRGFQQEIVGESHYQSAIERIVGGKAEYSVSHQCRAVLFCDDKNRHDSKAVEVRIEGGVVGFLPRDDAKNYRTDLKAIDVNLPPASVRAKIVGGWSNEDTTGYFGVKLNLKWPLAIAKK